MRTRRRPPEIPDGERRTDHRWAEYRLDDKIPMVYRIFDADDRLLYIGCTHNVETRIHMHLRRGGNRTAASRELQPLFAYYTTESYLDLREAQRAELRAIKDEAPLLNRRHNPRRWQHDGIAWHRVEQVPA